MAQKHFPQPHSAVKDILIFYLNTSQNQKQIHLMVFGYAVHVWTGTLPGLKTPPLCHPSICDMIATPLEEAGGS